MLILCLGQQGVQSMSKLMEQSESTCIAYTPIWRLLEVACKGDYWGLIRAAAWLAATAQHKMCCMCKFALPAAHTNDE